MRSRTEIAFMTKPLPPTVHEKLSSVIVKRPGDAVGAICVLARATSKHKKARYRCGMCLRGLVIAKRGTSCKMQGCGAVVVYVVRAA
jgi:hypothetical protein